MSIYTHFLTIILALVVVMQQHQKGLIKLQEILLFGTELVKYNNALSSKEDGYSFLRLSY